MQRKWMWILVAAIFVWLAHWGSKEIARQWLTQQAQYDSQQNLLNYIGDIRRALRRFYHLPYLVTNNADTLALVSGTGANASDLKQELIQLDKAANTKGWYILSDQGNILSASLDGEHISLSDRRAIVEQIQTQGEGTSLVSKTRGASPFYYLAAPVFDNLTIAGIVVVQLDLRLLTEQWLTSQDIILLQNHLNRFFLSSSNTYTADWLNEPLNQVEIQQDRLYQGSKVTRWVLDGKAYFAQTVRLDDLKWQLSYLSPTAPINQLSAAVGWIVSTAMLVFFLLGVIRFQRRQKEISQQRIQELITESEQRLNQMINKTQVGLLLLNGEGQIIDINPMAKRLFVLSDNMIRALNSWELFDTGNDSSTTLNLLRDLNKHRELAEISGVETLARRSDGTLFPVLFSLTSFPLHGQQHYLATVSDISKRKKAEQALREANDLLSLRVEERTEALKQAQSQLIEASKMAALGRMSSAVTHELNQPLTGLRTLMTTNTLLMERGDKKMIEANNRLMDKLIDRMANMTRQLKTFAYNKPERLSAISFSEALQEVLRIYQQRLENIDVRIRVPAEVPDVLGEEQRLRQVLGNLISNAIDAMAVSPSPQLTVSVSETNTTLEVQITDNGCGVEPSQLETIFEPFSTTKKMGEGLGLGLSISANNMRDLGGEISAALNPAGGMTFLLKFQLA